MGLSGCIIVAVGKLVIRAAAAAAAMVRPGPSMIHDVDVCVVRAATQK